MGFGLKTTGKILLGKFTCFIKNRKLFEHNIQKNSFGVQSTEYRPGVSGLLLSKFHEIMKKYACSMYLRYNFSFFSEKRY
jgi:hypothetical protein